MPPFLLRRRLRHVRSIRIDNVSAPAHSDLNEETLPFKASFIILESIKGEVLYVSEIQDGFTHNVQFNELPPMENPTSQIIVKFAVRVPRGSVLSRYVDQDVWLALRVYNVNLNKLQSINSDDLINSYNAPIFEMTDGFYTLPGLGLIRMNQAENGHLQHRRNISNNRIVQSFSFNSALKINKLIEYKAQITLECSNAAAEIESFVLSDERQNRWLIDCITKYKNGLHHSMQEKKHAIVLLNKKTNSGARADPHSSEAECQSLNEYYGNTYPNLIQTKDSLDFMRLKRLSKLIAVFKETCLFRKDVGLISFNESNVSSSLYERTTLNLVDKDKIMGIASKTDATRELMNTCLGYYLMFIELVATKIYHISLPYSIKYYGSTSLIEEKSPLYLNDSAALKSPESFLKAVDNFNKDLIQVIQRWEHHHSP